MAKNNGNLLLKIAAATLSRLVLNTARRFVYTFAPVLSRGLGVPLTSITSLVAINQASGLLGMFFGPVADRLGYRLIMLAGLAMMFGGMFAAGLLPFYGLVVVSLFASGLGKTLFDPAMQGYVGQRVPYHRRGLIIGILEVGWAGSTLIGIPIIGLLIESLGWRSPFFMLGGLGLLCFLAIKLLLPKHEPEPAVKYEYLGFWQTWRHLVRQKTARSALIFGFMFSAANDNLFVVYGAWLEDSFKLSVMALGLGTSVIGAAELAGEFLTATLADRLGLKKAVLTGLTLTIPAYLILPLTGQSLPLAWTGLFLVFITFEFTAVSFLSICTELMPEARATIMAGFLGAAGLGRVTGALLGGPVWMAGGIMATGLTSAFLTALGLLALIWGLRDHQGK